MAKNLKMKSARAALDMSQDALAKKIGVTRQTSFSGLRRKQNEHEKF